MSVRVSVHSHPMVRAQGDNGWACDGMNLPGGCKRGCTDFNQTRGWVRYNCSSGCNYDLCEGCIHAYEQSVASKTFKATVHAHSLYLNHRDNGWACDGRKLPGGCKQRCTGFHQTTG